MSYRYKLMLVLCLMILNEQISAQSWNYEKLKSFFSKSKISQVEGFFELDSDRKCLIGVIKNGEQYQIVYLFGSSENWTEGDTRGFIEKKNNLYTAKWDGSVKPGTVPLFSLSIIYDSSGFAL